MSLSTTTSSCANLVKFNEHQAEIPGTSSVAHLRENLAAGQLTLSAIGGED